MDIETFRTPHIPEALRDHVSIGWTATIATENAGYTIRRTFDSEEAMKEWADKQMRALKSEAPVLDVLRTLRLSPTAERAMFKQVEMSK